MTEWLRRLLNKSIIFTHHISRRAQKSGIKPDGIINFLSNDPPFEQRQSLRYRRALLCGGSSLRTGTQILVACKNGSRRLRVAIILKG
jgi:hypothetical protein